MIGEFVPGRHRYIPDRPLLVIGALDRETLLCAEANGDLMSYSIAEVSIDWHYDSSDGQWKPDFDGGP